MKKVLRIVGYTTTVCLMIAAFAFQEYRSLALKSAGLIFICAVAYSLCMTSSRTTKDLLKNVVIVCVLIGALGFVRLGHQTLDEDGMTIDEGFEPTYEQRAVKAVEDFAWFLPPALVGLWLSRIVRDQDARRSAAAATGPEVQR